HRVGRRLDAEKDEVLARAIADGPRSLRGDTDRRPLLETEALAVDHHLALAREAEVDLLVLLVLVEERDGHAGLELVERDLEPCEPERLLHEYLASRLDPHVLGVLEEVLLELVERAEARDLVVLHASTSEDQAGGGSVREEPPLPVEEAPLG